MLPYLEGEPSGEHTLPANRLTSSPEAPRPGTALRGGLSSSEPNDPANGHDRGKEGTRRGLPLAAWMDGQPHFFIGKEKKSLQWMYFLGAHCVTEPAHPPPAEAWWVNKCTQAARALGPAVKSGGGGPRASPTPGATRQLSVMGVVSPWGTPPGTHVVRHATWHEQGPWAEDRNTALQSPSLVN